MSRAHNRQERSRKGPLAALAALVAVGLFAVPAVAVASDDVVEEATVASEAPTEDVIDSSATADDVTDDTTSTDDIVSEPTPEPASDVAPEPESAVAAEPETVEAADTPQPQAQSPPATVAKNGGNDNGGGQETCPNTTFVEGEGGWVKYDGLSGTSFDIPAKSGYTVTDVCYKASTEVVYPDPITDPVVSTVKNHKYQVQDLSHVSVYYTPDEPVEETSGTATISSACVAEKNREHFTMTVSNTSTSASGPFTIAADGEGVWDATLAAGESKTFEFDLSYGTSAHVVVTGFGTVIFDQTVEGDCGTPPVECVDAADAQYTHVFNGAAGTMTVSLKGDLDLCAGQEQGFGLVSYTKDVSGDDFPQSEYDSDTGVITATQRSVALEVDVPDCRTQVDGVWGAEILPVLGVTEPRYGSRILGHQNAPGNRSEGPFAAYHGGSEDCGETPPTVVETPVVLGQNQVIQCVEDKLVTTEGRIVVTSRAGLHYWVTVGGEKVEIIDFLEVTPGTYSVELTVDEGYTLPENQVNPISVTISQAADVPTDCGETPVEKEDTSSFKQMQCDDTTNPDPNGDGTISFTNTDDETDRSKTVTVKGANVDSGYPLEGSFGEVADGETATLTFDDLWFGTYTVQFFEGDTLLGELTFTVVPCELPPPPPFDDVTVTQVAECVAGADAERVTVTNPNPFVVIFYYLSVEGEWIFAEVPASGTATVETQFSEFAYFWTGTGEHDYAYGEGVISIDQTCEEEPPVTPPTPPNPPVNPPTPPNPPVNPPDNPTPDRPVPSKVQTDSAISGVSPIMGGITGLGVLVLLVAAASIFRRREAQD